MNPWDPNLLLLYGTISLYDNVNITYAIYSSYECLCRPNEYSCDSTMFLLQVIQFVLRILHQCE